ncbi:MAG: hypothetical protein M1823_004857 [Watsoniomyces obsoletus]|nr:MAG: hypothetical protein M1823_004857 [Watsoniomyces obsoletus]
MPVKMDDADAIALRAAMSVLELQRERCKADLKKLEQIKDQALANPEAFLEDLRIGRLRHEGDQRALVSFNGRGSSTGAPNQTMSSFGTIPSPQNVVRCPPINWAKYRVVGEALDKLHAEQTRFPDGGEPPRSAVRAPEALIACPYRPMADHMEPSRSAGRSEDSPDP